MAKENWKATKKERELIDGKWVDTKEYYETKPRSVINFFTIFFPSIIALGSLFLTGITIFNSNKYEKEKIKYELQAEFGRKLLEEQYNLYNSTKDSISKLLASNSDEKVEKLVKELYGQTKASIISSNDTSIIYKYISILQNIELYQNLYRISNASWNLELYRRPHFWMYDHGEMSHRKTSINSEIHGKSLIDTLDLLYSQLEYLVTVVDDTSKRKHILSNSYILISSYADPSFPIEELKYPNFTNRLSQIDNDKNYVSNKIVLLVDEMKWLFVKNSQNTIYNSLNFE